MEGSRAINMVGMHGLSKQCGAHLHAWNVVNRRTLHADYFTHIFTASNSTAEDFELGLNAVEQHLSVAMRDDLVRDFPPDESEADIVLAKSALHLMLARAPVVLQLDGGSLRQSDSVLDIYEDTLYTLYTTRSPEFIESGSFKDGHTLREVMKEQGVRKEPGCSWVSLGGRVNKFYAGDQNHPQKDEVYAKLEELNVKVKSMGYIPELNISL
ncbi:hypothetical protein JRO89_XSUnG0064800 [Xanthoceras sorbifolium]|uniref:Uncharacterized protein n=1 Tax=Xanthoceras sorbifolium TaxID=99658 RepID=A0ABQ8GZR1_9ROSI|nr:hypothetical protein JRO89_XSUnG0064800 [Xanthoceras sorbifolium]